MILKMPKVYNIHFAYSILLSQIIVAKHYMTSRSSFEETARYWAEIYAGAPPKGNKPSQEVKASIEVAHTRFFYLPVNYTYLSLNSETRLPLQV